MKKIGIVALLSVLSLSMTAQNIVWQLKPTDYTDIKRFGPDLYQVEQNGMKGLIHSDGSVVIPVSYAEIMGFYEHKALVLGSETDKDNKYPRVLGYLTDDGQYVPFKEKFYALYKFYSEDMLPVADAKGNRGYLNERGIPWIGFIGGHLKSLKPFSEGYAVVEDNKGRRLIDKRGNRLSIITGTNAGLVDARSVYQGKAYVFDTDKKCYVYTISTKKCERFDTPKNISSDYLYRFSFLTGCSKTLPVTTFPAGEIGLSPKQESHYYGYSVGDKVILPAQFSAATPFEDGLAVVDLNGQKGILRYVQGGSDFAVSIPKSHFVYEPGNSVNCSFDLTVPEVWNHGNLEVAVVDKASGETVETENRAGAYSFLVKPNSAKHSYSITVASEGLSLWSGEISYTYKKIEMNLRASLSIASTRANKDYQVPVTATITNPGSEPVTVTITMKGSSSFKDSSWSKTIDAGGSVQVSSYFEVTGGTLKNQYVSVQTSKGGGFDKKEGLTLTPFY